jgi:hypothetical protein
MHNDIYKCLVYAKSNGEPKIVEVPEKPYYLTIGYVANFVDAENLDLELLEKTLREMEKAEDGMPYLKKYPHLIQPWYDMSARFHYSFWKALKATRAIRTRSEANRIKEELGKLRKAVASTLKYHAFQKLKERITRNAIQRRNYRRKRDGIQDMDLP